MVEENQGEVKAETPAKEVSGWKKAVAVVIDLVVTFFGGGYLIAALTGGLTESGFELNGGPAFALFALIGVYFYVGYKVYGKTIGTLVMGTSKK